MKVLVIKSDMILRQADNERMKKQFAEEISETLKNGYLFIPQRCTYEVIEVDAIVIDNRVEFQFDDSVLKPLIKR